MALSHRPSAVSLKTHFQGLRFTCLSVHDTNVLLPPSPPLSRFFYLPHISLTEHLCLCLHCSCGNMYHFLSASDDLSHFASPQECQPLNANLAALSVLRTHRRSTAAHTNTVITTLRRTRKLFHRLHFSLFIFHGYFAVFGGILVVGIKTEICQSLSCF